MNEKYSDFFFRWLIGILAVISVICVTLILAIAFGNVNLFQKRAASPQAVWQPIEQLPEQETSLSEPSDETQLTATSYPEGKLLLSSRREAYESGDMILEIPRLNLVCPVLASTDPETLNQGVCLFEYAQLPGVSNANTSVVAHRDIYGREFYNIHKITDGDLMYLTYEGKKYTYEYLETLITDASDWEPIKVKDFACITLQSCDPIGFAFNRIFVTGKLVDTQDADTAP